MKRAFSLRRDFVGFDMGLRRLAPDPLLASYQLKKLSGDIHLISDAMPSLSLRRDARITKELRLGLTPHLFAYLTS